MTQPLLNDGYFAVGTTLYPLPLGTNTLLDADKPLYYIQALCASALQYYVGTRFNALGAPLAGPTFSGGILGSFMSVNVVPYLTDSGLLFPILTMWRGAGKVYEIDISTHRFETTVTMLYIMPPMKLAQSNTFSPLLDSILKVLTEAIEYGHCISYNNGASIAPLAGYDAVGVKSYDRHQVNIPGSPTQLPFEMLEIQFTLREINLPVAQLPLGSIDMDLQYPITDGYVVDLPILRDGYEN